MLEQLFVEQTQEPEEIKEQSSRTVKRRKTASTPTPDIEEDDAYYTIVQPGGKKKGGIGYAGDQKEDVSYHGFPLISRAHDV